MTLQGVSCQYAGAAAIKYRLKDDVTLRGVSCQYAGAAAVKCRLKRNRTVITDGGFWWWENYLLSRVVIYDGNGRILYYACAY